MAIVEIEFDPLRRDLITLGFARRRSRGQPPRRPRETHPAQPMPPNWGPKRTRRALIAGGTVVVGAATLISKPWEWFTPETLESLATQAKNTENIYRRDDLSDTETRNKYTMLMADIFVRYYPVGISKTQLLSSVVWVNSKEAFEEIFINHNQDPFFPQEYLRQLAARTPAFTSVDGHIYINTANGIFQKKMTSQDPTFPIDWNPLKSLRLTLSHEFNHAIAEPSQDPFIFDIVDPDNTLTHRRINGFQFYGLTSENGSAGLYDSIDEASAELLSKYINTELFDSFISKYDNHRMQDITNIIGRLEKLLEEAGITKMELARFHKNSGLRGFLLLLAERGRINAQNISEHDRIIFGLTLFEALVQNNQTILQDYMNSAKDLSR